MPTSLLTEGDLRTVMDRMNFFETKLDKITDLQIAMLSGVRPTLQQSMHGQHAVNKLVTAATTAAGPRLTGSTAEPTDRQSARPTDNTESVQQPPVSCSVNPSVAPSTDDQSEPYHTVLSRNGTKKLRAKRRREQSRENAVGNHTNDLSDTEATAAAVAKKGKKGVRLLIGTKTDQINRHTIISADSAVSQNDSYFVLTMLRLTSRLLTLFNL